MQCPECSYISFKIEKTCGACGFKFKKDQKEPSLTGKESFSIFNAPTVEEGQKVQEEKDNNAESVSVLEAPEPESFIDSETGDFSLDLPEIEEDEIEDAQAASDSVKEISEYEPLEFDPNADIDLGEMEVEGLGLEPFQTVEEENTEEKQSPETEPAVIEESQNTDELPSLESALEVTQSEEEPVISTEPVLEIPEPEGEMDLSTEPVLEIPEPEGQMDLSTEPELEIPEPEGEQETPELDLGDNETKLDLSYEPPSPSEPDPAVNLSDVPDLNLEIDDSEGPLITQNNEIPDLEIEDLGLELESPDEPENDKT
ncbi:MAG: hypothetical protein F3743_04520 [Nitrospinae bacterium]|nr:hypothetical protein [Nitrospinota bacterium]